MKKWKSKSSILKYLCFYQSDIEQSVFSYEKLITLIIFVKNSLQVHSQTYVWNWSYWQKQSTCLFEVMDVDVSKIGVLDG